MKKRIGSFLLALMMILAFVAPIAATMIATEETYAATTDAQMLAQAKKAKTHTKYVIVSSYSAHKTKVYDTATYKVVKTFTSCGAKDGHTGQYYLTGKKVYDRDGEKKVNGKSVFHEYYVVRYSKSGDGNSAKGLAIHSILYKKGSSTELYHNKASEIQDADHPYKNNWSAGCTRLSKSNAKWIYERLGKGTGYYIMK